MSFSLRPGDRWEMSFDPLWSRGTDTRQFVTTEGNGRPETFGTRYVFAHVDLSEISGQFRLNYTFTPNLTLETYLEPFAASGQFHSFGELLAPRQRELLVYGTNGTTIVRNPDGTQTVTDGSRNLRHRQRGFQRTLVPHECRAALGMAAREYAVPGLAAESQRPATLRACASGPPVRRAQRARRKRRGDQGQLLDGV